jgi:hypothetical protein
VQRFPQDWQLQLTWLHCLVDVAAGAELSLTGVWQGF